MIPKNIVQDQKSLMLMEWIDKIVIYGYIEIVKRIKGQDLIRHKFPSHQIKSLTLSIN